MDDLVGYSLLAFEVVVNGHAHERGAIWKLEHLGLLAHLPEILGELGDLCGLPRAVKSLHRNQQSSFAALHGSFLEFC